MALADLEPSIVAAKTCFDEDGSLRGSCREIGRLLAGLAMEGMLVLG